MYFSDAVELESGKLGKPVWEVYTGRDVAFPHRDLGVFLHKYHSGPRISCQPGVGADGGRGWGVGLDLNTQDLSPAANTVFILAA